MLLGGLLIVQDDGVTMDTGKVAGTPTLGVIVTVSV